MAEQGVAADREHGRQLERASRRHLVADQVDAAVELVEAARAPPVLDRPGPDTDREQLGAGHHPELTHGEGGDLPVPNRARAAVGRLVVGAGSDDDHKPDRVAGAPLRVGLGTRGRTAGASTIGRPG